MGERSYWLGFSSFSGIGAGKFGLLLKKFGTAEKAWTAGLDELEDALGKALTPKFVEFRDGFDISDYEGKLKKAKVGYLTLEDEEYPELLKQIKKPPFVLYYKARSLSLSSEVSGQGQFNLNFDELQNAIAIVGTRRITAYGAQVTESLTSDLVAQGFAIVSGLAFGVDATAHKTTIASKGKTIAVLGCGVDCCYPRENQRLYEDILDSGGLIISEYPLGMEPSRGSFPSRNRIIAGLSQAVLVTEGAADSGALYTADEAFALGRPVFAVPGPITSSLSKGPHSLIGKGGRLIGSADDIIAALGTTGITHSASSGQANQELGIGAGANPPSLKLRRAKGDNAEERRIIELLQNESLHFDEIAKRSKIKPSRLGGILSIMEMKGFIKSLDAGFYGLG